MGLLRTNSCVNQWADNVVVGNIKSVTFIIQCQGSNEVKMGEIRPSIQCSKVPTCSVKREISPNKDTTVSNHTREVNKGIFSLLCQHIHAGIVVQTSIRDNETKYCLQPRCEFIDSNSGKKIRISDDFHIGCDVLVLQFSAYITQKQFTFLSPN